MGREAKSPDLPLLYKVFMGAIMLAAVYILSTPTTSNKEGFQNLNDSKFKSISGSKVYDDLYAGMYDSIFVRKGRVMHEIGALYQLGGLSNQSKVLDVGSGTGHLCGTLSKDGVECVGMDKSEAMIRKAKDNYPDLTFLQGDATLPAHNYFHKFDIVSCMYFTFYEMKNKRQFLSNCLHWLKPGGILVLHTADSDKLDPILPVGNVLISINPQEFAEDRITTTRAMFRNKAYKSDFQHKGGDKFMFVETITDRRDGSVKRLERQLLMPKVEKTVTLARSLGFSSEGQKEMTECGYTGQYINVFRKPS
tara:strand:- start:4982 stop:5902 length:921 start_codon:yes stop_codon:yes gene_type:complete